MSGKLLRVNNKVKIQFVKDRPGHDVRYALNSKKILKKLRWKPVVNIKEGLLKTIDWYIVNKKYFESISKKDHVKRIGLKI
jgi:dTDP-glucose 4,6-dehydratase